VVVVVVRQTLALAVLKVLAQAVVQAGVLPQA
jgi:hypothetical protein